jgi:hypothetical protein
MTAELICMGISFLCKVGLCQRIADMKSARTGVAFEFSRV